MMLNILTLFSVRAPTAKGATKPGTLPSVLVIPIKIPEYL